MRSLLFSIWVIISSVFPKEWVIIWVIIMNKPRSVFLFRAVYPDYVACQVDAAEIEPKEIDENAVVDTSTPENGVELESDVGPDEVKESDKQLSVSDV